MQSVFLALTIGFPFCIFKIVCGRVAVDSGYNIIGYILCFWGGIDFILNLIRIIQGFLGVKKKVQFCFLEVVGSFFKQGPIFLAVDTFLAFSIICHVLWTGWIRKLTDIELNLWLAATTVNLLSVATVQIWCEFKNKKESESKDI